MSLSAGRYALPTFFQKGRAFTLTSPARVVAQVPTDPVSATFALHDAQNAVVIASTSATVATDDSGTATIAITSSAFDNYTAPEENWREVWVFTDAAGVDHTLERPAYLVRKAPVMAIDQNDLYALHANFRSYIPDGQTTWQLKIEASYVELVTRLLNDQIIPGQILNVWAFNQAHIYMCAERMCMDFAETRPEYLELAAVYRGKADDWYKRTAVIVDHDDDGDTDGTTAVETQPQLFLTNVPWVRN